MSGQVCKGLLIGCPQAWDHAFGAALDARGRRSSKRDMAPGAWEGLNIAIFPKEGKRWIRVHHGGMAPPFAFQPPPSFSPHPNTTLGPINSRVLFVETFGALASMRPRCLCRPDARTGRRRARGPFDETERPSVQGPSNWMPPGLGPRLGCRF